MLTLSREESMALCEPYLYHATLRGKSAFGTVGLIALEICVSWACRS